MQLKKTFILIFVIVFASLAQTVDTSKQVMSLNVKDTDIRDVIRMISKGYNLNILLDQGVTGNVTLYLSDVPILEGLKSIAESNGLQVVKDGAVYKIQKATAEQKSSIRYVEGKLTVDIQNVDVKEFLKELSSKTAVSIVPDAMVSGVVTGKLYQVNLEDGLRALLEGNGFKVLKRRNIYQVSTESASGSSQSGGGSEPSMRFGSNRRSSGSGGNFFVDFSDGKVSLDIANGDLEDVIKALTEQSDVEIVTYGSIKSEVNAKLNNIPLTEALALLLGGTRFTFVQKDNIILIGDRNTATPSGQALSKSELVHLKHIKADNVPQILPKDIPPTNVKVIKEQNALLISGTSEDIVTAREFLKTIDIPTPQVRIDAIIVEYKDNLDKEFGVQYGLAPKMENKIYHATPGPEMKYTAKSDDLQIGFSGKYAKKVLSGLPKDFQEIVGMLPDDFFVGLKYLETQDKAKVLAQPSLLTLNGNKASIDVSETQYFKISTGVAENYTTRFQPIKFGIQLDITPWISQSGQITAEITPVVSTSEKNNNEGYPNVSSRTITTTVRLNDGETLILGGLIKNQEVSFARKIPVLADLPILGPLFKWSGKTRSKSNLVVYITPHIINKSEGIDIQKELEEFSYRDMNFIDRSVYKGVSKVKKAILGSNSKDQLTSPDTSSLIEDTSAVKDQTIINSSPIDSTINRNGVDKSNEPVTSATKETSKKEEKKSGFSFGSKRVTK